MSQCTNEGKSSVCVNEIFSVSTATKRYILHFLPWGECIAEYSISSPRLLEYLVPISLHDRYHAVQNQTGNSSMRRWSCSSYATRYVDMWDLVATKGVPFRAHQSRFPATGRCTVRGKYACKRKRHDNRLGSSLKDISADGARRYDHLLAVSACPYIP
jgi:hypothetical protein